VTTFVLVPGACHGGWWFEPLVNELQRAGHVGITLTLSGLGVDDPARVITLETHVEEATAAAADAGEDGVVLVGHSYGGSVISGVADRIADRVLALVYLDAFVPEDGDSCYAMTNDEQRRWYIEGAGESGFAVQPLPFFDERARPHPLATLVQRSRLTGAWRSVAVKHYVVARDWPGESPFAATTERLRASPGWQLDEWDTRHNVMHDGPARVLALLISVANEVSGPGAAR
jgi:pimeloyl-ACP methyl ester carboxylesterase